MPTLAQLYAERQSAKQTAEPSPEASNMAPWEKAAARVEAFEREQRMDPSTGVAGDMGRMVGVGLNQLADSGGYVLEKMGMERAGRWVQDKAQQRIQDLYGELTPEQQAANQLKFTRKENGEFGIGPAFTSPRALVGQVAASAPAMGFGMGLGGVVTRSLAAAGAGRAAAAGVGYGAGEGAIAGGLAGKDMVNEIRNAPIEALRGTEPFRLALESLAGDEGLSPEDREALAREKVATAAYLETAGKVGLATAILSAPSGVMFDKMLRGAGLTRNAAPSLAKDLPLYMAGEGLQEFPQEGAESIISGQAAEKYVGADPKPWSDHFEQAVAGGVTGAVTGGMMGGPAHVAGAMARRSAPPAPPENGAPQVPPSVDERTAAVVPQPTMEPEVLPPVEAGPRLALPAPAVTVTPDGTAVMPRQLDDMVNARLNAGGMSPEQVAASRRKLAGMEAPAAPVVPAKPAGALEKAANLAAPVSVVPEVVAPVSGSPAAVANHWDRLEQLAAQEAQPVNAGGVTDGVSDVQEEVGGQAQEVPAVRVPDVAPRKVRVKAAEPGRITFDVDGAEVTLAAGPNQSRQEFTQAVQEVAGLPISQAFVRLRERFGQAADVPGAQTVAGPLAEAPAAPAVEAGPNIGSEGPNIGAEGPNIQEDVREPWEYRLDEFLQARPKEWGESKAEAFWRGIHSSSVKRAVKSGYPVDAEVLRDYADGNDGRGPNIAPNTGAKTEPKAAKVSWPREAQRAKKLGLELSRKQPDGSFTATRGGEVVFTAANLAEIPARLAEVGQERPVPAEERPVPAEPAEKPLAVGDVFELDGVDYRIDSLDGGKVEAVDEDSGAVESWPNLEAFERQTGRRVADRGTAVGESQGVPESPVVNESLTTEPEAPALVKVPTVYGESVYVRQRDLDGDKQILPIFTKDGNRRDNGVHRDNIDLDGSKRKAKADEIKDMPTFAVISAKGDKAFASAIAAQREVNRLGLKDSHEVVRAEVLFPGTKGYVGRRKGFDGTVPKGGRPQDRGARKATAEGAARVEAAQKRLREVMANKDIVGKQRADMVASGRNLIQFLLTYADKDLETGFFKGDPIAYTQEDAPDGFRSFIYLDGIRAGEYGVERMPEARAEDAARTQREWKEQQDGFARVRAAEKRPSWPEFDDVLGRMEEQSRKAGVLTDANEGDWRTLAEGVARVEKSDVVSSAHAAEAISYLNAPDGKVSAEVAERKKAVFEAAGLPVPRDEVEEAQPATIVARGNGVEYGVVAVKHPTTGDNGYSLRVRTQGGEWAHSDNWAPTVKAIYERIAEKRSGTPSQIETADIVVDDLKARRQEVEEKRGAAERAQQNEKSRVASAATEVQRRRGVALEAIDAVKVKARRGSINVYMSGNETAPVDADVYDSVGLAIHRPVGAGTSGFAVTDVRSGRRAFAAMSKADAVRFVKGFAWRGLSIPDSMTKPYDETSKRERAEREQFGREALALTRFLNDKTEAPPEFWGAVDEKPETVDEQSTTDALPERAEEADAVGPTHPVAKSLVDILQKIDTITSRPEADAIEKSINKDIYGSLKDKQGHSTLAYRLSKRAEDGLRAALSLNDGTSKNKESMHRGQVDAFKESLREAIAVFETGYGAASDGAADLAATDKDGYPVISPDDLPTAEIVSAYSHTSHRPRAAAEIEQRQYVEFMQELKDDMLKDLPAGNEGLLAAELGRVKGEYLARRKRVLAVRGNTVSAHVAGRSKFDSKQAEQRGGALDKAEADFVDWLRRVPGEVAEAVGVAEVRTERDRQKVERKQKAREEADRREKEQRKAEIALPIVNRRGAGVKEITREEWSKTGKDYKSIIVSADGTFRYRSMVTQGGLSPVFITDMKVVEVPGGGQSEAETEGGGAYGVAEHTAFFKRLADGDGTAAEIKANFQALIDNREAIVAELSGMKKDDLLNMLGFMGQRNHRNDKKDVVVRAVYEDMQDDFVLGRGYSYSLGAGSKLAAIKKIVDGLTDADVAAHAEKAETRRQEAKEWVESRVKAMADPETLDDFAVYLRGKMADGMSEREARLSLSPEKRARFDALRAAESRKNRTERKTEQKAALHVAGQTVAGSIIETKHTKKGHDLFVVQLAERVERDDYNALNASAKKLGGYYSSFRGGGAVPGFQFTSRENAEAFVQLAGGDASAAKAAVSERMSAFEDDRTQGAAERLNAMADALEERADESLGRERKANTHRRAGMAARAEAAANADKALAQTMRNLAAAIENGKAEFLDRVREKKQVEYLTSALRLAKWNEVKDKYESPQERNRHENDPPTAETADYADYPTFTAFRSDLAALGRKLEGVDGLKQLGQRLLKVADDVTDAYVTFAKENLHKVSTFARKDGEAAMFASRQDAEAAIARSGYKGQAIVLPVKRGQNLIVLSPAEARRRGVWEGDDDKRITLSADFGTELMEKLGRAAKRNRDLSVPWQFESVMDRRKLLSRMGIETAAEFRSALREFAGLQERAKEPDRVKELERQMLGRKNDGLDFFPTPQSVADEMVAAADIREGMAVLEPSAGWGHIAERIREAGFEPEVVELSNERKELLEAKGFNVVGRDFLEINPRDFTWGDIFRAQDGTKGRLAMTPGWELGSERVALKDEDGDALGYYDRSELEPVRKDGANSGYDRIIMNPPFSDRRDIQHVYHAYDLLKPGGRLVAIMSEGVFFGADKKASAFREWVESVGGTDEKLEQGVFNDPSLPVNTGVAARMVVIDKQAGVEAPKFSVSERPSPRQQSAKFAEQVDRFLGGKMPGGQPLVVGHAPRVFLKLGVADRPMVMTQKNAAHVLEGKHGVDIETIKRLPELLDDPVAVLASDTTDGAYVVVTTALHNGSPVVVAVHPDERIGRFDVHLVASVYGKDNGKWFGEQAGNLRYLDESKNLAMHMTAGVQFPMVRGARQGSIKTLLSPRDLVKHSDSNFSVSPASYLTGDSGLGEISVAPARVLPFLRNALDAENLEAVSVSGGNSDVLREVGKLFGKRIVFFRERDGGRAESGRGGRGETPRSGRAVRHDAASGDLRRGTINGFMLPSRPDVIYLNVNAPDPLLRVLGHELGHSLRVEDAALWSELVKGLQPLVRNWSDFKAAKGDARYANLSDDALAEELFGDVIGENFLNELFWRDMARANESLFKRVAKKAVALLSKALRALTGRAGVDRYVSDMTQARAVVAKVLSRYGERAALGQYERFAKQEDSNYLTGRIDGKALLQRMMEMGHSLEDIARLVEGTRYAAAYHGSPHDFDRFSTEKIGTGEGAQAYGYGLYFAGSKEVAEWYQEKLSEFDDIVSFPNGDDETYIKTSTGEWAGETNGWTLDGADHLAAEVLRLGEDIESEIDASETVGDAAVVVDNKEYPMPMAKEALKIIKDGDISYKTRKGRLYQVELAPAEDEYLLWDKPLSEQSEKVKAALTDRIAEYDPGMVDGVMGHNFYKAISSELKGARAASEHLHSLGIRGIKYLDGTSRGAGDGNYNYVIFDENDVEITAKFSVASTAQDRAKAQAAFAKTLTADRAGAVFKTLGSMVPERMKAAVGSVLSNPHYESRKSKWRGAAYELALERGANANEIKHEVMATDGDYEGLEGVRDHYRRASKAERAMIDKLLVEGDIRGEEYSVEDLWSRNNPLDGAVPQVVGEAYLAFRRTLDKSTKTMFDRLGRLRLLPYEGSEFYQELIDLLDAGLSAEAVRRRFGINEKAVDAYMRIRADRKKLDEATKPYRDQPWHDTLRDAIVKGLGGLEMQNEFGKTPDLVAAFREIQKNGPLSIMTAEKFKKAQWYSILSDLLTQGDAHPMLKKLELYNAYLGVKEYDSQLAKLKDQWGQVKGYLPRIRKDGEQHVKVYRVEEDGTFTEVWMQPAKSVFGAKRLQAKVTKDLQGYIPHSFDPDAHYEVVVEPNTATPEEIFMGIGSHRAIEALLSKVFDKATDAGLLENRLEVQNQVLRILADEISSRGFGRHKLHRAEHLIEGYETENTPAILAQFIGGMAGWLSKSEFAMRANKLMAEIPATRPEDKTWVREYVDDALKNSTWLDQWFGTARSFAALMYLGFKASSAILNATQNYVWGQAVLSKHTGGATAKLLKAQADVLRDHLLTRAGKDGVLTEEERWVLEEGLRRGRTHANFVRAVSGLDDNGGVLGKGQAGIRWLTEKAMTPFQMVEVYWNREPALLAGYRVFRAQGLEKEAALAKAEKFADDVHFVVSKENIPGLLRKMGPAGRTLYTFQSYSHNYLLGMFHAMKDGEVAVVLRSLTALVLFGGLAAVPFGDDLDKWYRRVFGERPLRMLEKWLKETAGEYTDFGDQIADFVIHGAPALAGVNFSRALGVNVSFLSAEDDTLAERLGGVWGGLANKVKFAGMAAAKGDAYRAVEFLSPEALANLMRSYRHWEDGATTLSGSPVFGDDGRQVKYTATEGVIRAFGFMPLRPSKNTEKRWDARLAREFWNDRKSDILAQWRRAPGDKKVLKQIQAFNRELRDAPARPLVSAITPQTLRRALKAKPNRGELLY